MNKKRLTRTSPVLIKKSFFRCIIIKTLSLFFVWTRASTWRSRSLDMERTSMLLRFKMFEQFRSSAVACSLCISYFYVYTILHRMLSILFLSFFFFPRTTFIWKFFLLSFFFFIFPSCSLFSTLLQSYLIVRRRHGAWWHIIYESYK